MVNQPNENDGNGNCNQSNQHKWNKGDKPKVNQLNEHDGNGDGDCNTEHKRKKANKLKVCKSNEKDGNGSGNGSNWNKRQDSSTGTDKSARILSCDDTDDTEELSKALRKNFAAADNVHHKTNNCMSIDVTTATSTTNNGDTWKTTAAPAVEFPLMQHEEQYNYSSASSHSL